MSYSPIQSSGAGKIEQIRNSQNVDFEREDRLNSDACSGEIEKEYCKLRTCCARYWSNNKTFVRPNKVGDNGCDKVAWLIDNEDLYARFHIPPMMTDQIDFSNIRDMRKDSAK